MILERDLGSVRQPPMIAFFSSVILFGLGLLGLYWFEKDRKAAKAAAEAASRPAAVPPAPAPEPEPERMAARDRATNADSPEEATTMRRLPHVARRSRRRCARAARRARRRPARSSSSTRARRATAPAVSPSCSSRSCATLIAAALFYMDRIRRRRGQEPRGAKRSRTSVVDAGASVLDAAIGRRRRRRAPASIGPGSSVGVGVGEAREHRLEGAGGRRRCRRRAGGGSRAGVALAGRLALGVVVVARPRGR